MKNPIKNIFKVKNKADIQEWVALADFLGIDKNMSKDERSEATYFACLKILTESVGKLPLKLMKKTVKNGVAEATSHKLYSKMRYRPNRFMTATTFWGTLEYYRNHHGNGIAYISSFGDNLELIPLDYSEIEIWYDDACILSKVPDVFYLYNHGGKLYKFGSEEVIHLKSSISDDGIKGLSVREILSSTIDGSKKAQKLQNKLYDSGFTAKAAVQYTGDLNDKNVSSFLSNIEKYAKGEVETSKSLIPIPLGSSLIPLNTKLGDNEFLELKRYSASQIAAAFGIKPVQINDYSKASYSSSENQNLSFLIDTLLYILKQYEEELNSKLLSEKELKQGYYFKFNTGMLLRADLKTQVESLTKGISNFLYTPNEARSYIDLPSKEGGDSLVGNGSTIKLEQVGIQYGSKDSKKSLNIKTDKEGGDG